MSALSPLTQVPPPVSAGPPSGLPGPSTTSPSSSSSTAKTNGAKTHTVSQTVPCEIVPPPPPPPLAPAPRSAEAVKAYSTSNRPLPVSVSTQEIQTESSLASQASFNSLQSVEAEVEVESVNGDLCKGGYGYRFDFRSSCEFDFTEDVYI